MKILSFDTQEIKFDQPYKNESLSICTGVLCKITGLTKIYKKTYLYSHSLFIIIKTSELSEVLFDLCKTFEYRSCQVS